MHAHMRSARSHRLDGLQIRFGQLLGLVVGMAYLVAAQPAFSANLTCACHGRNPPCALDILKMQAYLTIRTGVMQGKSDAFAREPLDFRPFLR